MGSFEDEVKAAFEPKYGRDLSQAEVFEIAFNLRQFATLLREWARDEELMRKLGIGEKTSPAAGTADLLVRAATHAADNTRGHPRGFP